MSSKMQKEDEQDVEYIFRPWITVKGKRIYPKKGKAFKIPVKGKK